MGNNKVITASKGLLARPLDPESYINFTEIPKSCVPKCINDAAVEVGRFLGNGVEPAIISAMSITCALLSKNVQINEIGEDKKTYCSSGIIVAMSTGTRKTEVYKIMNKPFIEFEKKLQAEWDDNKYELQAITQDISSEIANIDRELQKIIKKGAQRTSPERITLVKLKAMAIKEMASMQTARPNLHIKDVTEPKALAKMSENNGAMAIISDDSRNIIKNILGRHGRAGDTAEGYLIDGINGGSQIKLDRVGSAGSSSEVVVDDPCLNVYLMVQPDLANKLKNDPMYIESGLAARVPIYYYPINALDIVKNSDRSRRLDKKVMSEFYSRMEGICVRRYDYPLLVTLSVESEKIYNDFNMEYYRLLLGEWSGQYNKTNKMITQAVIYSMVVAAIDDLKFAKVIASVDNAHNTYEIAPKYAKMGCGYVRSLYSGMVKSNRSIEMMGHCDDARKMAIALVRYYSSGKMWEGFVNTTHLINTFSSINKDNRYEVLKVLVSVNWLFTTTYTGEKQKSLNKGFPGGKVNEGDNIYHLNFEEVKMMLRRQFEEKVATQGEQVADRRSGLYLV